MYIIAEIGSNFESIDDCIKSIKIAKECGADAVKFQHYTAAEMWGSGLNEMMPIGWLPRLKDVAKEIGIHFSCTFFSPEKLQANLQHINFIKIASSNMMDKRLLDIAKASGKKTIISTGGHTLIEMQKIYNYFPEATFMYCVSEYPSIHNNKKTVEKFQFKGFSDHSLEVFQDYPKCVHIVEKHVNLCGVKGTPDAPHSLGPRDFELFCNYVKGDSDFEWYMSPGDKSMRELHNVRLIASAILHSGTVITKENTRILRSIKKNERYINAFDADEYYGRKVKVDLEPFDSIKPGDVE